MLVMRACTTSVNQASTKYLHVRSQRTGNGRYQVCMERRSQ